MSTSTAELEVVDLPCVHCGARDDEMEGTSFNDLSEMCASVRTSRSGASAGITWWWITGSGQSVRCM